MRNVVFLNNRFEDTKKVLFIRDLFFANPILDNAF